jgi:uncharacterized protein (TIGR02145 family)
MKKYWYNIIAIFSILIVQVTIANSRENVSNIVSDYDGNVYKTVAVGKQIWMVENLRTTHFRDGKPLLHAYKDNLWYEACSENNESGRGAYCSYDDEEGNRKIYGLLYNSYAITDSSGLCPEGWHVPTREEWKELESFLGGEKIAGGKLKEAGTDHWAAPNTGATNESGFTALPGGFRFRRGQFASCRYTGYYWSSGWKSLSGTDAAWFRLVSYSAVSINKNDYTEGSGFSVRCLKD